MNVFCVDLGYSLKRDLKIWNNDNCSYAGHILYGVNHMEENGIHPIFEFGQHGMIYGKWYMFLDEIVKFFSLFLKRKEIDAIWIPHAYYSKWIPLLRKLKLIKTPVIVCMHNKNNLRRFIYGCDEIVTINPCLYEQLCSEYPDIEDRIHFIPLAPESISIPENDTVQSVDVISIGNTKRDFGILIEAMRKLPYSCRIITNNLDNRDNLPPNVEVMDGNLSYAECLARYQAAKIIVIPMKRDIDNGVFGLTSLVDALTVGKPVVVTKTKGIGIPVQDWECGIEVNDSAEMSAAIERLMQDRDYYTKMTENILHRRESFNMRKSSKALCEIIRNTVKNL